MLEHPAARTPYKGVMPYVEEDAPLFFGRDADRQIIIANLHAARLTILYGASGVGKSSILQAGVQHQLHQQAGRAVVVFNGWQADPVAGLKQAIAREFRRLSGGAAPIDDTLPLATYLARHATDARGPVLIILDQFEEFFLYQPPRDDPASFAAEFARAVNDRECPASFLVALREDALAKLDRFERRIAGLFDNYLRLDHLDYHAARQAIVRPLDVYNEGRPTDQHVIIEEELIGEIIQQVRIGQVVIGQVGRGAVAARPGQPSAPTETRVEAPYLQIVLTRLWDEERARSSRVLRLATLRALAGAESIVRTHLDQTLSVLRTHQRETAAQIFYYLVTPSGSKIAHTARDLASYAEMPPARVEAVARRLSAPDLRVLRPLMPTLTGEVDTRYEIFHDVLAPAILDWRARYLRRSPFSRRLGLLLLIGIVVGVAAALFDQSLPAPLLILARGAALVVSHAVVLMQIFRFFGRYARLAFRQAPTFALGSGILGLPLAILLEVLWYSATAWPTGRLTALAGISPADFVQYYIGTSVLSLAAGLLALSLTILCGQITHRLFNSMVTGVYGAYIGICTGLAAWSIAQFLLDLPRWIRLEQ